jgi:hypothetical protein
VKRGPDRNLGETPNPEKTANDKQKSNSNRKEAIYEEKIIVREEIRLSEEKVSNDNKLRVLNFWWWLVVDVDIMENGYPIVVACLVAWLLACVCCVSVRWE